MSRLVRLGIDSKNLLRACPHHGFSELHQLDTFYNALNVNDQDSLNSAAGGNFLDKRPADCSSIIESKSKVRNSRSKAIVAKVSTSASTSGVSPDVAELKDMVRALLLDKQTSPVPIPAPAPVKGFEKVVLLRGAHHSVIVRLPIATITEITSKNTSRKQPQQISTKEIPVTVRHRWQTKSDHPVFLPCNTTTKPTIRIVGTKTKTVGMATTRVKSNDPRFNNKPQCINPRLINTQLTKLQLIKLRVCQKLILKAMSRLMMRLCKICKTKCPT
ncbi:hypothetical protein Tco_0988705 [Tanacetum coccineum]|uniref:Uncharacterized protein n=1 Tax=Tanacetum coccineum TaxID=301880 RepID=A0ABQ5ERP3_9ASTR